MPSLVVSRFGVIPKAGQSNKWRLIVDLSSPEGRSVNDGIRPEDCSLTYISVDNIAEYVKALGRGALLPKSDMKQAYRQVPVHPKDRAILGLRLATLTFSALANALEWVVRQAGVRHFFHYIHDFVIIGPPPSPQCDFGLLTLRQASQNLGLKLAEDKTEGPSTRLTVLGIEVDAIAMTLLLPEEK